MCSMSLFSFKEMKDGELRNIERPNDFPERHHVNKYFERMVAAAIITPQVLPSADIRLRTCVDATAALTPSELESQLCSHASGRCIENIQWARCMQRGGSAIIKL